MARGEPTNDDEQELKPTQCEETKESKPQLPESDIPPGQRDAGLRKLSPFADTQPSETKEHCTTTALENDSLDCSVSQETSKLERNGTEVSFSNVRDDQRVLPECETNNNTLQACTPCNQDRADFASTILPYCTLGRNSSASDQCDPSRNEQCSSEKSSNKANTAIPTVCPRKQPAQKDHNLPKFQTEMATVRFIRSQQNPEITRPWISICFRILVKRNLLFQWLTMMSQQLASMIKTDGCSTIICNRHLCFTTEKASFKDQCYGTLVLQLAQVHMLKTCDQKVAKTIWQIRCNEYWEVLVAKSSTQACDMPTFWMSIYKNPPSTMSLSYISIIAKGAPGGFRNVNNSGFLSRKYSKTVERVVVNALLSRGEFGVEIQANTLQNNKLTQKQCRCIKSSNSAEILPKEEVERRINVGEINGPNQQTQKRESATLVWKKKISKITKKMKKKVERSMKSAGRSWQKCIRFVHKRSSGRTEHKLNKNNELVEKSDASTCFVIKAYYPAEEPGNKQPPPHLQDENQRWVSFHKLGHRRLPTETLARNGFFLNDDNMAQCHSCAKIVEMSDAAGGASSGNCHYAHCRYKNRQGQIASDTPGRVSDDVRDPPGQQSIYIPPGDVRVENYRLSTFEQFPVTCPISRRSLANSGFYFTGFFDRVKCYACGRTVEQWEATDNPADFKWHKITCPFPRGEECGNVPSTVHFNRFHGNVSTRPMQRGPGEEVLEQTDPVTGAVIRTVRYPTDLPERIRQTGGIFEIGPNNQVRIQSGPGAVGSTRMPGLQRTAPAPARLQPTPAQRAQHQPMRQWRMANVISADHKRFLTNLYLNRELDRVASFARWPTGQPNVAPAALAKTGFFYLGDMDRTQCFSCGGVLRNWTSEDDAASEHRTHFPNCRHVLGSETLNVPVPDLPVPSDVRQRDFPCRFPANPHMRSEAARLETFDRRWSRERTAATPAEIAQAGFFFLGERDRAKCWYCNGGLQHWDYDDVPWIEHAKWFPNCQFLLSVKGQHFVYRHLAMNPQLPRPIIARQDGSPLDPGREPRATERPEDIPPSIARIRQPSPPPTIIDPREEMRKRQERVENVLKNSDVVKNVLAMGFSERIVRMLLLEKVESGTEENPDDIYGSTAGLLDDAMKKEEEIKLEEEQRSNVAAASRPSTSFMPSVPSVYSSMSTPLSSLGAAPGSGKYNVSYMDDEDEEAGRDMYSSQPMSGPSSLTSVTPAKQSGSEEETASIQEALNKIEDERMCKVCFSNPADMVFIPCGHMCCCMECTQALRQCPVCRIKIDKAIKTYLA